MLTSRHISISLLILLCCESSLVFAQKKAAGKRNPAAIMKSWDKNGDGLLQPDEIPKDARSKVTGFAKSRGMNPSKPIKIDELFAKKKEVGEQKQKLTSAEKKQRKAERLEKKNAREEGSKEVESNGPKTKGFGRADSNKPNGFGRSDGEKRKDEAQERRDRRFAMMARALMFQNDKNKNGRLEKSEWSKLKGNPTASDVDKDGVLTKEELAKHLAGYGSREKDVTKPRKKASRSRSASSDKKSYRFLTPHERLPDGLPVWFAEKDENGDGQLSLREYAGSVTNAKVRKFQQFDVNNDGMLVAKEYLQATK